MELLALRNPLDRRAFANGVEWDPVANHPFRPEPNRLTVQLAVVPDDLLRSKGSNLEIDFFYCSQDNRTEYGSRASSSLLRRLTTREETHPDTASLVTALEGAEEE